ncbi:flagellar hook-associated protein FlgK [Dyella jejuensis]|uniref:Flagellar hook-associated protein 1 n=1 Tax=Dyella jejuensis TaxID=1432009 RepID=A0ABW8JHC0_9GAMM
MNITHIGMSGMLAAQAGLGMSARNISNQLTAGYSRQGVLLVPRIGGGVEVGSLIRFNDSYKTQQLWASNAPLGQYAAAESYYKQLEEVMGLDKGSVKAGIDAFFGALDEVSTDPTNTALRQQVISAADAMAKSFNSLRQTMLRQLDTARQQSSATADQANMLSGTIADLNRQIQQVQATGEVPSELLDQRDQAIDRLSALIDVQVLRQPDGTIDVSLANGPPLVAGDMAGKLSVAGNADGTFNLELELAGTRYPLDGERVGGMLGGLSQYTEQTLLPLLEANKQLASELADRVNTQLAAGYGTHGEQGKPLFQFDGSSGLISINPDLTQADLGFSNSPTEPGNSANLLALIELRKDKIDLPGVGEVSLGDACTMLIGKLGSASQLNQNALARADEVRAQAELDWRSVSDINEGEESVQVSDFLNMYNANMKVISVANQLFESTLQML